MANPRRGEVEALINGRPRILVLTLGALAELEAAFGADDLIALAERLERGRLSAREAMMILAAGLSGAGTPTRAEEVASLRFEGGAVGAARLVGALLAATFGTAGEGGVPPDPHMPQEA
ncbi:gene transfer agent family protein [Aquabacter sp. L1I39]|uniref:gene transfer agent family protein n=1 Tax=Aquabacter sp. L1I39 TaxID=2820278 RepID=UPI001ADC1C6B|nr:gene transfer agent family protein [Aquabacter sp. L1I39]QTL05767.1 gene transfer agent family protein [Aquabacter sp. L1I39]